MITLDTADQLDNLGLSIFNPHTDPVLGTVPGAATGLTGQDDATDAQYYALIAPVMLAIDGRVMAPGYKYTLNVTNALQGRPKHWFMNLTEFNNHNGFVTSLWPAGCGFQLIYDVPTGVTDSAYTFGWSIGLATCAAICHCWAQIIRMWLAGNYPVAVTQPA